MHGQPRHILQYLKQLYVRRMSALVDDRIIPRDGEGQTVPPAGAFGVPKDPGRDRAITNRMARNATQLALKSANLPHGSQFCLIVLGPNGVTRFRRR